MCRTTANSPCLSLDKYTTGCQSAPCSWKSETFIPFYGYTNSHWQLAKLLNLNRKVFSIHSKYAVQPVIIVARKPIYSEVWSRARMRVSLMSQRKYDSGVTKGTSSSSMLVRPEPSLKKSNISKMQILLSLSLLFSTVTGAFSSASSVYPQSVFWPASLPLSLWSDLLDKNGEKNELPQCFRKHGWLMEISDLEAYIQAVRDTGKHGLWNAVMTISLTLFFLPIHSFNISPPSFFQLTWEESWKTDFVSHVSSPLPHPIHSMLSIFLHHSSTFLLFPPLPSLFLHLQQEHHIIHYTSAPPVSFLIMSVFHMLLTVNTRQEPICQAKCFLAAGWKACGADLKSGAICYLIGYAVCVDFSYRGEQGDNGTVSATSGIPQAVRKWKTTASQTFECL